MNWIAILLIATLALAIILVSIYVLTRPQVLIEYGNIKVDGQRLTAEQTAKEPTISVPVSPFTVVLFDKDAPASRAQGLDYLHWATTSEQVLVPYQGPTPPPGTGTHRYQFNIYNGTLNNINDQRSQFNVKEIELQQYDSLYFTVDS